MTITVKGQITIPQALRERYRLLPGTQVVFVPEGDALRIKPRERKRGGPKRFDRWLEKAAGSARTRRTTDQILAESRGED